MRSNRFDYLVAPSGSCAGMIKNHYPEVLKGDATYEKRARALAAKTYELTSFLVNVCGVSRVAARCPAKASYHDSCSSLREMNVKAEPRSFWQSVDGLCAFAN